MSDLREFRVFVSSTFGDFKAEREVLQAIVFPRLKNACRERGASFLGVDLRWGISPERGLHNQTMQTCLEEIKRCQEVSPRPNFLILIGERYGWRPLREGIPDAQFEILRNWLVQNDRRATEILDAWYKKDENANPTEWVLLPREGSWSDHESWTDEIANPLHDALRAAAAETLSPDEQFPFWASATHQEIQEGFLSRQKAKTHVFAWRRVLADLSEQSQDIQRQYTDEAPELDELCGELQRNLGDRYMEGKACARELDLDEQLSEHLSPYLERFANAAFEKLWEQIKAQIDATAIPDEEALQLEFAAGRAAGIVGRETEIARIADYLSKPAAGPYMVTGKGGIGKTSLLAACVIRMQGNDGRRWITRFVGATPSIGDVQSLLESLWPVNELRIQCEAVSKFESASAAEKASNELLKKLVIESEPKALRDALKILADADNEHQIKEAITKMPSLLIATGGRRKLELLNKMSSDLFESREKALRTYLQVVQQLLGRPIVVVFDALDQLQGVPELSDLLHKFADAGGFPEAVWIVASTRNADNPSLAGLSNEAWKQVVETRLAKAERKLQPGQRAWLDDGRIATNGNPLWLKLAMEQTLPMHSWDEEPGKKFYTIPSIIQHLYDHLDDEHVHGKIGGRALRYLALSRTGIPEDVLLECLAKDEPVKTWFRNQTTQTTQDWPLERGLPPILWSRLQLDLEPYLVRRNAYGTPVLGFFHREFYEEALGIAKPLKDKDAVLNLANAAWNRLTRANADQGDFAHLPAALYKQSPDGWALAELPWLLKMAGQDKLAGQLLELPSFVMAKACLRGGVASLYADYALVGNHSAWKVFFRRHYGTLVTHPEPRQLLVQLACQESEGSFIRSVMEQWLTDSGSTDYWIKDLLAGGSQTAAQALALSEFGHEITLSLVRDGKVAVLEHNSTSVRILNPDVPTEAIDFLTNDWQGCSSIDYQGYEKGFVSEVIAHGNHLITRHKSGPVCLWLGNHMVAQLHYMQCIHIEDELGLNGGDPIEVCDDSLEPVVRIIPLSESNVLVVYQDGMVGRWRLPDIAPTGGLQQKPLRMDTDDVKHFTVLATDEGCSKDTPNRLDVIGRLLRAVYHEGDQITLVFTDQDMPIRIVVILKGEFVTQFCGDHRLRGDMPSHIFAPIADGCCYLQYANELVLCRESSEQTLTLGENEHIISVYADVQGGFILVLSNAQDPDEPWSLMRLDGNLQETHRWEEQLAREVPWVLESPRMLVYLTRDGVRLLHLDTFEVLSFPMEDPVFPEALVAVDENHMFGWRGRTMMLMDLLNGAVNRLTAPSDISNAVVRENDILTGHVDGFLCAWSLDLLKGDKPEAVPLHGREVSCMARIDETTVLSCSPDKIILWHSKPGQLQPTILWFAANPDEHDKVWEATVGSAGGLITWGEKAIRIWEKKVEDWVQTPEVHVPGKPINGVVQIDKNRYLFELGHPGWPGAPDRICTLARQNGNWSVDRLPIPEAGPDKFYSLIAPVLPDGMVILGVTDEPNYNLTNGSFAALNMHTGEIQPGISKADRWLRELIKRNQNYFEKTRLDLLDDIQVWGKGIRSGKHGFAEIVELLERSHAGIERAMEDEFTDNPFAGYEPTRRLAFRDMNGLNGADLRDIGVVLRDDGYARYFDSRAFQLGENLLAVSGQLFMIDGNGDLRILQLMQASQPVRADWLGDKQGTNH